jgi:PAS domain S-box-containing protein
MASPGNELKSKDLLEAQLRATLDVIPAYAWYAAPSGALTFVNKRLADYLGLPKDHTLRFGSAAGAAWDWHIALLHPDDREESRKVWSTCVRTGRAAEFTFRVPNAEGVHRWFITRAEPLRASDGTLLYWIGVNLEIDELKQAQFYLSEGQRLAHMGSWAFTPTGFEYWSSELFRIHGLDPKGNTPTKEEYLALVHREDREFVEREIQNMLANHSAFEFTKRIVRPDGEIRRVRCVGNPVVENRKLQRIIGTAIDVTEHELLTEELRRREAYLTEAQRLSHTGSFGWRPDTGEIVWSDETYRIFEYDPAEKPTVSMLLQRTHPQDRALVRQVIENVSTSGTDFEHEYRLLLPDGRVKHVHAIAHAAQNASSNREIVGAVTDITERKTTEDKIRRLVEADILGIFIANVQGEIVEANQAFLQMLQYGRQDLVSGRLRWTDLTPAELRERDERALTEALAAGVFHPYEKELLRKDGSRLPVLIGGALFQSANEGVVFVLDLSKQKRSEERIRGQEMEFREMLDLSSQQVAVFGPGGERLYANRVALDYVGLSLEEWRQTSGSFFRPGWFIHPDDRERVARAYSDGTQSSGSAYELEMRVRGADGNYRWFLVRYNPLHDDKGQVTRWYVASTDIDERKRAEERLQHENVALREEIDKTSMFEEIVGTSPALKGVLSRISKVAPSDSTVLITGETGTGKELVARAVHRRSDRASRAFVSVNCAAIPRDLIASELFGHEKGSFTGATQQRLGRFELANGGTIFLDEVGELPAETQIALLRVLQEHEFERVGGTRPIRADVRVIAATNRDLQAAIRAGSFRSDLFYRLYVFPIEIPPLRERGEDIPLLVEYFIDRYARKAGKTITSVDKKTLQLLQSYPFPGNIRELQNVIERSVIVCETETFSVDESWLSRQPLASEPTSRLELSRKFATQEKELIEAALRESRGRVSGSSGAAAKLGIPGSTLESKIRSLKINKNHFKSSPSADRT